MLPSQRQSEKKMYEAWVAMHQTDAWVLSANCTCMAGLGSACSHVAAILFKVHAAVQLELNKVATTSKLCEWRASRKRVDPSPLSDIIFKKPKKTELLPTAIQREPQEVETCISCSDPSFGAYGFQKRHLLELKKVAPDCAFFTSLDEDILEDQLSPHPSDTDSGSEDENNSLPEPMTCLFQPHAINLDKTILQNLASEQYNKYQKMYKQTDYDHLRDITVMQSKNTTWLLHRVGRITASNFYTACHTSLEHPAKSFIETIMQYKETPNVPAIDYGIKNEDSARDLYASDVGKQLHENLYVCKSGLWVDAKVPHLGASPDALVSCSCHGNGLLEIKCPLKYRHGLDGWDKDDNFPIAPNNEMKINHKYYYQIQGQMMICNRRWCDLLIYTETEKMMVCHVPKDDSFIESMHRSLDVVFHNIILPELVSRSQDPRENVSKKYCLCNRPAFGLMIPCGKASCKYQWFHYSCVNLTRKPKNTWFCQQCITFK